MESESSKLSVVPDLDRGRIIRTVKRLARKGLDMKRVWCIDRMERGRITHSLVMPYSYVKELTPAMQDLVVRYVGKIR